MENDQDPALEPTDTHPNPLGDLFGDPVTVDEMAGAIASGVAVEGDRPGEWKLPEGKTVRLTDCVAGAYYSALILDPRTTLHPDRRNAPFEVFSYSQAQMMANGESATAAHTNVPRPGSNGLPQGYEGVVTGWRARLSVERNPIIDAWAASVQVVFKYREKFYKQVPLLELLEKQVQDIDDVARTALDGDRAAIDEMTKRVAGTIPVRIRENLSYSVVLSATDPKPVEDLRAYLASTEHTLTKAQEIALARLDTMTAFVGSNVAGEIQKAMGMIAGAPKTFILWIFLDGFWLRPVV